MITKGSKATYKYCSTVLGWNTNPYLRVSIYISNFGVNVVIFSLSQTCFKLSDLSPGISLAFQSGSCNFSLK
jgi:hypothetical protein